MSRYRRNYDEWDALTPDEAFDRAYALGVAASFDEYHPEELEAIREEMESAYNRSVVDLAFDEGRTEAPTAEAEGADAVWDELVEGELVTVDPAEVPTGGRAGLPEALEKVAALERPALDRSDAVDLPEFLEKD
jgi:type III secretion system FlhB-like substrate exporter